MSAGEIHVGDNNTQHIITVLNQDKLPVDMALASAMTITYVRADNTTFERTPILLTDGSDGKIKTTLLSTHLTVQGKYTWQGYFTFPSGSWRTDKHSFVVHDNIP